jgi:hypothetical protein
MARVRFFQQAKFELLLNRKTARSLGWNSLLTAAIEVIE